MPPVNVNDVALPEALDDLRRAAAGFRPLDLVLGPASSFAPVTPTLYLEVGGPSAEQVRTLHQAVFRDPFALRVDHPFVPHVTVAAPADDHRLDHATELLRSYRGKVSIDRVHVMQQQEDRRWVPVADLPFAESVVVGRGSLPLELTITEYLDPPTAVALSVDAPVTPGLVVTARRPTDGHRSESEPAPEISSVGAIAGKVLGAIATIDLVRVRADARGEGVATHLLRRFLSHETVVNAGLAIDGGACPHTSGFLRRHGFVDGMRRL